MNLLSMRYSAAACLAILALHGGASASTVTFETGQFTAGENNVFNGLFAGDVAIGSISVGEATYRADLMEFIEAASVRVYVDRSGDGRFNLLTDEAITRGQAPVGLALGRDSDTTDVHTALDAVQGLNFSRMLYTDGTATVRMDVLLALPLHDDRTGEDDGRPEALVIGSFDGHDVRLAAMVAGNVNSPVLAGEPLAISDDEFATGQSGIEILIPQNAAPHGIAVAGCDLSGDLAVDGPVQVIGFRLEIGPGKSAMFNVLGGMPDYEQMFGKDMREANDSTGFGGAMAGGGNLAGSLPALSALTMKLPGSRTPFRPSPGGRDQASSFDLGDDLLGGAENPGEIADAAGSGDLDIDDPSRVADELPDITTPVPAPPALALLLAGAIGVRRRRRA